MSDTVKDALACAVALALLCGCWGYLQSCHPAEAVPVVFLVTPTPVPSWTCAPARTPPCNGPCP